MFIRKTTTSTRADGSRYVTYRIVESERINGQVKKRSILSLGGSFDLDPSLWKPVCQRIEEILYGKQPLFPPVLEIEDLAQKLAAKIIAKRAVAAEAAPKQEKVFNDCNFDDDDTFDELSVGGCHIALHAAQALQIPEILEDCGFKKNQISMALTTIVGRMLLPGSESATWEWLKQESAIGELLGYDISRMSVMRLHRVSDLLIRHKEQIETALYDRISRMFPLVTTVLLLDLTNTFFEGQVSKNGKAKRGRSKERRSDAPLVTLGLVLDGNGFVIRSSVFPGNVSEPSTVEEMLAGLGAQEGSIVIMDRGPATKEVLSWLVANKYRYLVVSREKSREFDADKAKTILTAKKEELQIYSERCETQSEVRLMCYSPARDAKETGITERFVQAFEDGLRHLHENLSKPRTRKGYDYVLTKIGRMQEASRGVSQHYRITVSSNIETKPKKGKHLATAIHFERKPEKDGDITTHPGVYSLRTNALEFDDETIWRTYIMLNDLEAVFRSMKSELGLRPVYHHTEERCDAHLFITVLAYQCVQMIRTKLKKVGINSSWNSIRKTMNTHLRATHSYHQRNGDIWHIRRASKPGKPHLKIYEALGIDSRPGGRVRTQFKSKSGS